MASSRQGVSRRCRRGFTLAEVLICSVIVLIGFMALVAAFGQESVSVQRGEDATVATSLADEIRDMALKMSTFAEILALNGQTFTPLVLSSGETTQRANWSQHVTVTQVSAYDLNSAPGGNPAAAKLTVDVNANGRTVLSQTYYMFDLSLVPFTDKT